MKNVSFKKFNLMSSGFYKKIFKSVETVFFAVNSSGASDDK